jgi:hypothetical protein
MSACLSLEWVMDKEEEEEEEEELTLMGCP